MDKFDLENIIKDGVNSCANESGWANLAELGTYFRLKGIKYGKLSRFLQDYSYMLDLRIDESLTPPAVYARLKK